MFLSYSVSYDIFAFLAFPKKLSEKDKNDFTVAAVIDLIQEESDGAMVMLVHLF